MSLLNDFYRILRIDFGRIELRSPLPPDECETRLQALTSWHLTHDDKTVESPVIGEVTREDFFLYARPNSLNSLQTCLTGRMSPSGAGTKLEGQFTIFFLAKMGLLAWFVLGGWYGLQMMDHAATAIATGRAIAGKVWPDLVLPPVIFLLSIGLIRLARAGADAERRLIIRFLTQSLDARTILEVVPVSRIENEDEAS